MGSRSYRSGNSGCRWDSGRIILRLLRERAMAIGAIVLGIVNIFIVVALLILVGLVIVWGCNLLGIGAPPPQLQKVYLVLVGLIALYMLLALLFGLPSVAIIRG